MTRLLPTPEVEELARPDGFGATEAGFGALSTPRGHLPLTALDVKARVDGLLSQVVMTQTFVNSCDEPLEATYIFPLPDRTAVTGFRMDVAGRVVEGKLDERGRARQAYEHAIESGQRAAIAEEDRSGVFTLRVGNLLPGESASVRLTLSGVLPYDDGEVTFRFPLVVAPRYVPGVALAGPEVGSGTAPDTDAAPDASRISPPILLPGFPNPLRLSIAVELRAAAGQTIGSNAVRVSLHAVRTEEAGGICRVVLRPDANARLDRDFIVRYRLGAGSVRSSLSLHPDAGGQGEGTFALTVVPPSGSDVSAAARPREVVFVLDRSGSMEGWKIVAARRALARMVDTLGAADRFAVVCFDSEMVLPTGHEAGLIPASDRNRFRAVEFLAGIEARGGTEMAGPLAHAVAILAPGRDSGGRERLLVLVTDGQVANEDQILQGLTGLLRGTRVFALGIDRAVNEGFLRRLAEAGGSGGGSEVVESEERLDATLDAIHRRIGTPLLTNLHLEPQGWSILSDTLVPERPTVLFAGSPVLILGRFRGAPGPVKLSASASSGAAWREEVDGSVRDNSAIAAAWGRGQIRKLEDRYVVAGRDRDAIERAIVQTSLNFGVLSRFTSYFAIDASQAVNPGGQVHQITQPVEMPQGWSDALVCASAPAYSLCESALGPPPMMARPSRSRPSLGGIFSGVFSKSLPAVGGRGGAGGPYVPPGYTSASSANGGTVGYGLPAPQPGPDDTAESFLRESSIPPSLPPHFSNAQIIGQGGLGTIYKTLDTRTGRPVALKLIPAHEGTDMGRFLDRLRAMSRLNHPSIVRLYEFAVEGDHLLMVFELLEGRTLTERLQAGIRFRDAAEIVMNLAAAVAHAHENGLMHGFLSTSQVLSRVDGTPALSGFDEHRGLAADDSSSFGDPHFMSPERALAASPFSPLDDVYGLGVILYQLLTRRLPFEGRGGVAGILKRHHVGEFPRPRTLSPKVPKALEAICLKAMAREAAQRYRSASELADALRGFLAAGKKPGIIDRLKQTIKPPENAPAANQPSSTDRREGFWK
jgi:Ca-activated chloride channel family protein